MSDHDIRFMALALSLGQRGLGQTWPNPSVGAVIVHDGRIVGRGWTQPGGRPHAEAMALAQAGENARGATAYVSLEPCSHVGKTPPCALALIEAGIQRVVCAVRDPDPRVAGRGVEMLRAAGIEVFEDVLGAQAKDAHIGFFSRIERGRPSVTLKLASSLDGRIATATGESQWITGPIARRRVHQMRACHDAVLIGGGTARDDNPSLTVRDMGARTQPVRIVASSGLNVPLSSELAQTAREIPVWMMHGPKANPDPWVAVGAKCVSIPLDGAGQLDASELLKALGDLGLTRVFCEGGGQFAASLLNAGLVDDLVVFQAGLTLGSEGRPGVGQRDIAKLSDAVRFELASTEQIGVDSLQMWRRTRN